MGPDSKRQVRRTRARGFLVLALVASLFVVVFAACGGDAESESADSSSGDGDKKAESDNGNSAHLPIQAPAECGGPVVFEKQDPDGVLAELTEEHPELKEWYEPHFAEVHASAWRDWKGKKPPWKIGYVSFPTDNPWKVGLLNQLKADYKEAKDAGLVEGNLEVYIQPSWDTATPEQQNGAIQQMIRDGVDILLVHPLNSRAQSKAFDAAGKAGVPVILTGDIAPDSKYTVNVNTFNQGPGFSEFFTMLKDEGWFGGEKRSTLVVRGIQGNTFEQTASDAAEAAMKPCEGIDVVGTVWGEWNPATTKAEVQKFLASHPGKIDFVMHEGSMAAGVIQAFEQTGRDVPPMPISGTSGGDLAWWCDNKDDYQSVGYHFSGEQMGHATFQTALRMLDGKGLKVADIPPPAVNATSENICDLATPGKDVTWVGDIRGDVEDYLSQDELDWFFDQPGSPAEG
jgi:ribose transport system substrate-binding protein